MFTCSQPNLSMPGILATYVTHYKFASPCHQPFCPMMACSCHLALDPIFQRRDRKIIWIVRVNNPHPPPNDLGRLTVLTSTKLLVMRCWYLSLTLASVMRRMTVWSSTKIEHRWAAHDIVCPMPSSMIFVVRYSVQQLVQNRCPHSMPVIICEMWRINGIRYDMWKCYKDITHYKLIYM